MASSIQLLRSTISQERPFPANLLEGQPSVNLNASEPGLFFRTTDGSLVKFGPAAITSDGSPPNSSPQGLSGNTAGELWLDKSLDPPVLKIYDGTAWIDAGSGGGGGGTPDVFIRWIYTAVGGETSLSGGSGGILLEYQPGLEEVFVNGVLITRGVDYTATTGTSVTNLSPLTAGDVVTITSFIPTDLVSLDADSITYTQSGTGAVTTSVGDRLRDFVSVKDYGAAGDNSTDDTSEINRALARSSEVFFPDGTYVYAGTNLTALLSGACTGPGKISYDGQVYPVSRLLKANHLWAGNFFSWDMGSAISVSASQRTHIPAGVTIARSPLEPGCVALQIDGAGGDYGLRVLRSLGNTGISPATVVLNLSQEETKSLVGKDCCLQFNARVGAGWSGGPLGLTCRAQYSPEAEQAITKANGEYSSGHNVIDQITVSPSTAYREELAPYYFNFTVPADAVQIAVCFNIPFLGSAIADDFVDLSSVAITLGDSPALVEKVAPGTLKELGRTRYQASYPYMASRANTEQGALQTVATANQSPWGIIADVRFNPRMSVPPQFTFLAPGSGVEFRWLDKDTGGFIFGTAYDLSDSGVTLTNTSSVTAGRRYICQWIAQAIL